MDDNSPNSQVNQKRMSLFKPDRLLPLIAQSLSASEKNSKSQNQLNGESMNEVNKRSSVIDRSSPQIKKINEDLEACEQASQNEKRPNQSFSDNGVDPQLSEDSSELSSFADDEEEFDNSISQKIRPDVEVSVKQVQVKQDDVAKRIELGGILVYDAHARIIGCPKMQDYYNTNQAQIVNPYILFTKKEVDTQGAFFNQEARERDFGNDQDKILYQKLPKFDYLNNFKAPQYTVSVPALHNMLIFDSRFESGNLRKASKVNNIEYNLWLENDLNTKGHTQWYYFKVVYKADKPAKIQFNILNLAKTYSLYKVGMKPVVFSKRKFEDIQNAAPSDGSFWGEKFGWFRDCENIRYFQNEIPRYENNMALYANNVYNDKFLFNNNGHGEGVDNYFTLSFEYRFEHCEDEVWFAHAVPYTYTNMQRSICAQNTNDKIMKMEILCKTLSGLPVPLLTITENVQTFIAYQERLILQFNLPAILKKAFKQKYQQARKILKQVQESKGKVQSLLEAAFEEEIRSFCESNQETLTSTSKNFVDFCSRLTEYMRDHSQKKAIVLTSRVHPGEPQASFMLEGSLQFLLSDSELAKELRRHFVFLVVPMLNPDGVVQGNYRCSLLGCDLNRKWVMPNKFLHAEIFYTKQMIRYLQWERKVQLYTDMHGHSRKQNTFFFGCNFKNYEQEGRIKNAQLRIIPLLCCHKNPVFSFSGCSFRIEKCKESTGRVVVFKEFNIMNSFTLECSFHGTNAGPNNTLRPLTLKDMISCGSILIQVLENYLPREQTKLNIIGSKVLDIFYDEFVKFVPAYILKREEEKRDQSGQNDLQQTKKINKTLPNANQKPQVVIFSNMYIISKQIEIIKKSNLTDVSDTECFSQIIGFQEHQQETIINEFENFVQKQYNQKQDQDKVDVDSSSEAEPDVLFNKFDQKPKKKKKRRPDQQLKPIKQVAQGIERTAQSFKINKPQMFFPEPKTRLSGQSFVAAQKNIQTINSNLIPSPRSPQVQNQMYHLEKLIPNNQNLQPIKKKYLREAEYHVVESINADQVQSESKRQVVQKRQTLIHLNSSEITPLIVRNVASNSKQDTEDLHNSNSYRELTQIKSANKKVIFDGLIEDILFKNTKKKQSVHKSIERHHVKNEQPLFKQPLHVRIEGFSYNKINQTNPTPPISSVKSKISSNSVAQEKSQMSDYMQQNQFHPQGQLMNEHGRKVNLQKMINQIKYGVNEDIMEEKRKKSLTNIVGVSFGINKTKAQENLTYKTGLNDNRDEVTQNKTSRQNVNQRYEEAGDDQFSSPDVKKKKQLEMLKIKQKKDNVLPQVPGRTAEYDIAKQITYATRQSQEIVSPKPDLILKPVEVRASRHINPKVTVRVNNKKQEEFKPPSALASNKRIKEVKR